MARPVCPSADCLQHLLQLCPAGRLNMPSVYSSPQPAAPVWQLTDVHHLACQDRRQQAQLADHPAEAEVAHLQRGQESEEKISAGDQGVRG